MGKCFILPSLIRECEGCRHSGMVWEDCPYGKKKQLEQAAPALYEALKDALDTAQFESHPYRPWHDKARAALALVDGEEVVNAD